MGLGLGASLNKTGLVTPGIVTDNLVMKHNYSAGAVVPVSDGAAYFDGDNDYINTSAILSSGTTLSVACWIKPSGTENAYMGLMAPKITDTYSYQKWLLRRNDSNEYEFIVDWSSHTEIASTLIEDGKWHHLCGTYDGTTIKLYLDGVLHDTETEASHDISCDLGMVLGNYWVHTNSVGSYWYDGYMCNAGVWTGALTQPQVKSIMNKNYAGLSSTEKENLVSWWNLDETVSQDGNLAHIADNNDITFGSELVTGNDSTFSGTVVPSNWSSYADSPATSTLSCDSSKLTVTVGAGNDGNNAGAQLEISSSIASGNTYKVEVDLWLGTLIPSPTGAFVVHMGDRSVALPAITTTQTKYTSYLTATSTADLKIFQGDADGTGSSPSGTFFIDNVSVKLVNGNMGELK